MKTGLNSCVVQFMVNPSFRSRIHFYLVKAPHSALEVGFRDECCRATSSFAGLSICDGNHLLMSIRSTIDACEEQSTSDSDLLRRVHPIPMEEISETIGSCFMMDQYGAAVSILEWRDPRCRS